MDIILLSLNFLLFLMIKQFILLVSFILIQTYYWIDILINTCLYNLISVFAVISDSNKASEILIGYSLNMDHFLICPE